MSIDKWACPRCNGVVVRSEEQIKNYHIDPQTGKKGRGHVIRCHYASYRCNQCATILVRSKNGFSST